MKKYIAKEDSWFKEGTEVKLIEDFGDSVGGLFEGIVVMDEENLLEVKQNWKRDGRKLGDEFIDREICSFDEFEIKDE